MLLRSVALGKQCTAGLQTVSPYRSMKLQAKSADAHKLRSSVQSNLFQVQEL